MHSKGSTSFFVVLAAALLLCASPSWTAGVQNEGATRLGARDLNV